MCVYASMYIGYVYQYVHMCMQVCMQLCVEVYVDTRALRMMSPLFFVATFAIGNDARSDDAMQRSWGAHLR